MANCGGEKFPLTLSDNYNTTYETIISGDKAVAYHNRGMTDDIISQNGGPGEGSSTRVLTQKMSELHCHSERRDEVDKVARRRLIFASILCLIFMIGEAAGGLLAHSLAIATDAAHLLTDFASFMISLLAIWLASRPATKKMSFGWARAEVIGALTSVLMIWVVTGILVYMAVQRIIYKDFEIDAVIMLITAGVGVTVNIIMGVALNIGGVPHGHSHFAEDSAHSHDSRGIKNINVRAAFIHVIGDFIQSLGVFIAALVIYFKPEYAIIDPICTFLFSVLVLITTFAIMKDTLIVLMEGMPKGMEFLDVQKILFEVPGVLKVHQLRIWSISLGKTALSAHIAIAKSADPIIVLNKASKGLKQQFDLYELTLQIEEYKEEMQNCEQCQEPSD